MDFSYNDVLEHVDLNNILLAAKGWGVLSGLAVSEKGAGADMSVDVALGEAFIDGVSYTESGTTNVAITAADATHARKDLIIYDTSTSAPIVIDGTPAATPQPPDITASDILLALVDVAANDTSISDSEITDKIILIQEQIQISYITASDILLHSNDTVRTFGGGSTYTKLKETRVPATTSYNSTYRIKFDMISPDAGSVDGKVYRNGAAIGTERSTSDQYNYTTYSEDLIVGGGDFIQVYVKSPTISYDVTVRNFRLYGDLNSETDYTSTAGY